MENKDANISKDLKVNQRQKEIIRGLIEQSFSTKNLANMYIGALKVLNDESNPERIHQSAHSLRELVKNMTAHIEISTETNGKHKEKMKQLINQYDELGGVDKEAIVKQWHDLHKHFVKLCHHGLIAQEEDFKNNLLKLEYILSSLLGPVYDTIEELDHLINIENPIEQDMEIVKTLLKKQSHYRYFIKNLHHPNWLDLLIENQFFEKTPQAGEYSVEPLYLAKIADKKPTKVVEIIKKLSRTTHEGAQVEFIKALMKVPINESLKLKNAIKRWISNAKSGNLTLSKQITKYIKRLFKENEIKIAFELVTSILAIREEPTLDNIQTDMSTNIRYNFDDYIYGEIVKDLFPELKLYNPLLSLRILSKMLVIIIIKELEKTKVLIKGDNDLSLNWRRIVDEHDYYTYKKDIKNILVSAIRDLILFIGNEQKTDFNEAIKILRENNYLIFRRIELYAIRFLPVSSEQYINEAISNKLYFNELFKLLEYFKLLEDCFLEANEEFQQRYINWVKEGPDIKGYIESFEKNWKKSPSEDDLKSFIQYWRRRKLTPVKKYLSKDLIKEFKVSDAEVEKINPFNKLQRVKIGPISPINKEEMEKMAVQDILKYVKDYQEAEDFLAFSKVGLGRILRDVIAANPHKFTSVSIEFLNSNVLHKYISFFFDGFRDSLKKKNKFEWQAVISLSKAILVVIEEKEVDIIEEPIFYKENTLRDIKTSIGWLIEDGLTTRKNSIPFSFKNDIMEILNALITDKEPTLEEELNNIKGNWRIQDMAINTVRGIAMNAVIDYGLWYANKKFDDIILNDPSKAKLNMDVKKILEKHLDYTIDSSYTIRYIFGLNLNKLIYLDKKWIIEHINSIFPSEVEKQEYWEAAWSGYLDGNITNQISFKILREHYNRAIKLLNDEKLDVKLFSYSVERLANEIMRLYIHGIEDLKSKNSLVNKFFLRAPDDILKLAIAFIGQNLSKLNDFENFEEILKRLMELWEDRLSKIKKNDVNKHKRELTFFLFWFKNSIFDKKWTISKLEETLDLTRGSIGLFSDVLDTFVDYVGEFPLNIINCLEKIVKNQVVDDGYLLFQEKYKPILKLLLDSENQEAKNKTKDLINYLGNRDLHYFRDLLN